MSNGTEIGSSEPYEVCKGDECKGVCEESIVTGDNDMDQHVSEPGEGEPFVEKPCCNETELGSDGLPFNTPDNDSTMLTDSEKELVNTIYEAVLNVFGKHPAYQKEPMTTPENVDNDEFGRSWDDESVKGDKPFGTEIGKGDPFSEKVVNMLTDAVLDRLKKKVD